ncbi:hypothetical protein [Sphingomonas sp. M1-B02]|uniref:hypothetical protein n=1 Tax=Sphingomonas sp. M1-B02 TaxID=3114300 RepID=UPI00223EA492|nr:hypothetical protein [Sphingomonas sp. S6-11]UZK66129.1 hypothetical protein OKW87_16725 [Sphingomonas sp. S6-11]
MRTGFSPTRRNRNIGTAKQGHGQDNRLVIPLAREHFSPLELVGRHRREERTIHGQSIKFIIEEVGIGSYHPCTVGDVARMLELLPLSDWVGIKTIVFRQPTRKQAILNPAWGRLRYWGELSMRRRVLATGPMIFLDAVHAHTSVGWSSSLGPEDQAELDRLRDDGHVIERVGRRFKVHVTPHSARNTQLYRTLLHEVGHWFDWLGKVEEPVARGEDFDVMIERYFARPGSERESFAHRYADEKHEQLFSLGLIPFDDPTNDC